LTVGLARLVPYGEVIGVDRAEAVLHEARGNAEQASITNAAFEVGDVYSLAFEDETFDVVHAHQLLQHLSAPVEALSEMRRVCRPEGVVAARDSDYAAFTWWPPSPELDEWLHLYHRVARSNRAEPDAGRRLKAWARAAGFQHVIGSASAWCFSSPEDVTWWGGLWADRVSDSSLSEQAKARGFATQADLDRLADGWRRWAGSNDAWFCAPHGEVVCRP
jgi:SAM-dependent methyltransferase